MKAENRESSEKM